MIVSILSAGALALNLPAEESVCSDRVMPTFAGWRGEGNEFDAERGVGSEREARHRGLIDEVGKSWRAPELVAEPSRILAGPGESGSLGVELATIVFPSVSFTRATIGQVVGSLAVMVQELDRPGLPKPNLVLVDPGANPGEVTLALRNVSLKRVLDLVTAAVGCTYEVKGDAIVVQGSGKSAALETAIFAVSRATVLRMTGLNAAMPASGNRGAKRTEAAGAPPGEDLTSGALGQETGAMRRFLQLAGVDFEGVSGASLAYDGAAIIVTQTPSNLERVRGLLARYREARQVEIEAKFMEVQEGALEELGLNWSALTQAGRTGASRGGYATGNRALSGAFTSRASSQLGGIVRPEGTTTAADGTVSVSPELDVPIVNNAPQLPGATELGALAGPLANVTTAVGEFDVNAIVRALAQRQGTDLLSAPRVTVLSGNPATITVAQEMRYPQSFGQTQSQVGTGNASGGGSAGVAITAGTPQEFTTRNIGVELRVTPTVEDDNYSISLDLNPRVTEFDGFVEYGGPSIAISGSTTVTVPSGFYQPIFSVRDISTKVTVWDGATLMMGGLTREEVKKVTDKVPVLGDLPLVGRLFRSKGKTTQKRNLIIFVRARLVNPGGEPQRKVAQRDAHQAAVADR